MKKFLFLFLVLLCVYGRAQKVTVDTSRIAIIISGKQTQTLSASELVKIETLLIACIKQYNIEQPKGLNLSRYKRQYSVTINKKGEKEVWVNCFCSIEGDGWKHQLIMIEDGGDCYFNLMINLSTGKHHDFFVNGKA